METSLTALGYVDLLRIPRQVLEEYAFPAMEPPQQRLADLAGAEISADALEGMGGWPSVHQRHAGRC